MFKVSTFYLHLITYNFYTYITHCHNVYFHERKYKKDPLDKMNN